MTERAPALPTEHEALDADPATATSVAEQALPSRASLRAGPAGRGGAGTGRCLTPDGARVTSPPVARAVRWADAVNPGSSGGALAAWEACLVGVNTAVAGMGLGVAVPMNRTTDAILAAVMRNGRVRRAYLGIAGGTRALPPATAQKLGQKAGVEVQEVVAGSPAPGARGRTPGLLLSVGGGFVAPRGDPPRPLG